MVSGDDLVFFLGGGEREREREREIERNFDYQQLEILLLCGMMVYFKQTPETSNSLYADSLICKGK